MTDELEIPIWSIGINFKVYKLDEPIKYDELVQMLRRYPQADIESNTNGWLTEPEFVNSDGGIACFAYLIFKKNANASRLQVNDAMNYDYTGFSFDFNDNLLIVSTAGRSKLELLDRVNAFKPIRDLSPTVSYEYSGKFLFWLSNMFCNNNGSICDGNGPICDGICIDDIPAITNNITNLNLSDAVTASTQVTHFCETKVILGLNGAASGIRLKITALNSNKYEFNLYTDGRIVAKNLPSYETIDDKIQYAKEIHNILQKSYVEYKNAVNNKNAVNSECWSKTEEDIYRIKLLKDAKEEIDTFIESAVELIEGNSDYSDK